MNLFKMFQQAEPAPCKVCGLLPSTDSIYTAKGPRYVTRCPNHSPLASVKMALTETDSKEDWRIRNA